MNTIAATVSVKGQITIPQFVRKSMDINTGDKIHFIMDGDAVRFMLANNPIGSLKGMIKPPKKAVSLEDMQAAIKARGAAG